MKLKLLLIFFIFLFFGNNFSQTENILFPYYQKGLWGFADSTGKIISKPEYEYAGPFYDGMALVKKNGLFGYVNSKGKVAIAIKNSSAENFSNGTAKVTIGNTYNLIDKNGKDVSPWKKQAEAEEHLKKKSGKLYQHFSVSPTDLCIASRDTQIVLIKKIENQISSETSTKQLNACLDLNGKIIVPLRLWIIKPLCYDFIFVEGEKEKYVYSREGNIILKDVKEITSYDGGTFRMRTATGFVFLDSLKNKIINLKAEYSEVSNFINGKAKFSVIKKEKKYFGILNSDGSELLGARFPVIGDFHEGLCIAEDAKGMKGVYDSLGKNVVPFEYEWISSFNEGIALAKKTETWMYINTKGKEILKVNYIYESISIASTIALNKIYKNGDAFCFHEGLAVFVDKGKYGFIDKKGTIVIEAKYELAEPFHNGVAAAYRNDAQSLKHSCTFIDMKGNELFSIDGNLSGNILHGSDSNISVYFPYCTFLNDGKNNWTMFDLHGKKITEKKFSLVYTETWLHGKFMRVALEQGGGAIIRYDGKLFFEE